MGVLESATYGDMACIYSIHVNAEMLLSDTWITHNNYPNMQ